MNWHRTESQTALEQLDTNKETGLTASEAAARLSQHGPNELVEKGGRSPLQIFWAQLTETMVLILIVAALAAGALGDTKDAIAILAIVLLFAILGFIQEYRAEQAIAALKKMAVPMVKALRDGGLTELSARELVPGDIVQLETGNLVPADLRLLETVNLQIQEAALTGESEPVNKHTEAIDKDELPLGDRRNMAYLGTVITGGRGQGLVVATGMETELGRIAELIQQVDSEGTPLQRRLDQLGKMLAVVGVGIAALIFVIGVLRGDDIRHMLLTAVSVAVAIVPEGLPAVVTITLALGSQRMLKRQALIRKLPAVETLGSVTVICSDKTGTLTENRMTVQVLDVADHRLDLTEEVLKGGIVRMTSGPPRETVSSISLSSIGGALCNDATLLPVNDDEYRTLGDPTEGALLVAAARLGYWKNSLDKSFQRAAEVPFDSERKRMTTVHDLEGHDPALLVGLPVNGSKYIAFTKGSVDGLLEVSERVWVQNEFKELDNDWRARIQSANDEMAAKGMRVLGVALRLLDDLPAAVDETLETSLTLVGLFGMIDPPRPEVRDAVATCRTAGIRPVMITGDHPLTALEIARQLGIVNGSAPGSVLAAGSGGGDAASSEKQVITGAELEKLSFDELKEVVEEISVFARVSPEHKLRIVQTLQERGHIVSMTGDGVNDAPALRRADIGVAMGITGTDVSKEASDLVLLDDNFATIVAAVGEGRTIYDNIRKFVRFSVAGNLGKVLVMLLAPFLGKPIPLLPLQLLWLNLLTDGLLGLGMGVEGPERDTMKRQPYSPREGVFSHGGLIQVTWVGGLIGALALALGAYYFFTGRPEWQTMVFTFLAFAQVFQALASRSSKESLFKIGLLSNPMLAAIAALVVALQLAVLYIPFLSGFFDVLPLSACDLSIAAGAGVLVFVVMELEKIIKRDK
ncbi:MAG: cation-translocating P-type ATPase [Anaerolineales bacterium]|jgi:Ca2+-transporting ATPase